MHRGIKFKFSLLENVDGFGTDYTLYIHGRDLLGNTLVLLKNSPEFIRVNEGSPEWEVSIGKRLNPLLDLKREEAINLMDNLWQMGIRPSNGEGAVGQIGAIKNHLNDMRALVFKGKERILE